MHLVSNIKLQLGLTVRFEDTKGVIASRKLINCDRLLFIAK